MDMADPARSVCLIVNENSGSFDEATAQDLLAALGDVGYKVTRIIRLPGDNLPNPAELDADGMGMVAIFTGDGTISSAVAKLAGWRGAVLVLPGGTMNLLSGRLHEDADLLTIVKRLSGETLRRDMPVICRSGKQALVGISAGPGAIWYDVRETMRDGAIGDLIKDAGDAIGATIAGPFIHCREPHLGREDGYPLIELEPSEEGIRIVAYTAETLGDYLEQGWAMLMRRFREGPHEVLGYAPRVRLAVREGDGAALPIALSIDGEPVNGDELEDFSIARSGVDLIATAP